jgi:hypothetical protein
MRVVGAHLQPDDAVRLLAHRGQHDNGQGRDAADSAAEAEPILPGQHEVEHDKVDPRFLDRLHHCRPVSSARGSVAVPHHEFCQQCADLAIVIDDEEVWKRGEHGSHYRGADRPRKRNRVTQHCTAPHGNARLQITALRDIDRQHSRLGLPTIDEPRKEHLS